MHIALTPRSCLRALIVTGLLAFFLLGGVVNLAAPAAMQDDYARWGFPDWFHLVTGTLELAGAALIARQKSRRTGALLCGTVMLGALATLLLNREFAHAVAPVGVMAALALSLYLDEKALEARWEGKLF